VIASLLLVLVSAPGTAQDLDRLAPTEKAAPLAAHEWSSKGGLRYVWWVPKGYDGKPPRNLTVILHGTGLDYRWGFWNNRPGVFRPDDVVVSVDGTSPGQGETRLFLGEPKDAKAFREFLEEMRETFAVDRIFLYGHSQGGFFVVYFAGEHPDAVDGVVAHASGAWNWSKTGKPVKRVAIAFMHGTADPVVPYRQSPGSRDHYAKLAFPLLHLRRLPGYNHWPNAVRATEALDWCEGMTTARPERALALAEELLRSKGLDEYQYETPVSYAGARAILRRFESEEPPGFAGVDAELARRAAALADRIEKEGAKHVDVLRRALKKGSDLKLDGKPWLGHVLSVREDFRGVETVGAFVEEIDLDRATEKHAKAAEEILKAWYDEKDAAKIYRAIVAGLPRAFLFEGFPPEMGERMAQWKGDAQSLKLTRRDLDGFRAFEQWKAGWDEGVREYEEIWKKWK
jgi:predicted esterase